MVDLPDGLTDNLFDDSIKRGAIIRTKFKFESGKESYKYFIAVSRDTASDPLVFIITTSKIDFYHKHPVFNNDIVGIQGKSLPYFPIDTVLDCRQIYPLSRQTLKENFRKQILEFCGELPEQLIQRIDDVVKTSKHISTKHKKLILGDY